jgi:hypothetical protein
MQLLIMQLSPTSSHFIPLGSKYSSIGNKGIEDVSSAPFPTKKDDDVLALIRDGSIDRSALYDMGAWPIRISDSFRDFMVKRRTSQLQDSDSHFPEDESERLLTKHWFDKKNSKMVERYTALVRVFLPKRCAFLFLLYIRQSELS